MADDNNTNPLNEQENLRQWETKPEQATDNASESVLQSQQSHNNSNAQTELGNENNLGHTAAGTNADTAQNGMSNPAEGQLPYKPAPLYGAYAPNLQTNPSQTMPNGQDQGAHTIYSTTNNQPTQQMAPLKDSNKPGFGPTPDNNANANQNNNGQRPMQPFGLFNNANPPQGQPAQSGQTPQPSAAGGNFNRGPGVRGAMPPAGGQPGGGQFYRQNPPSSTSGTVWTAVISAVLSAALMLGLGWAAISNGWVAVPNSSSINSVNSNSSGSGSAKIEAGQAPNWQSVAQKVSESVVSIQVQVKDSVGAGSGAIVDTQGHVVTNNHVVADAQRIQVTLSNGQIYTAKIVGTDSTADLAVIKLEDSAKDLKPVEFADSDKLAVGEPIMAIGNPLGYENTATTGIISALNRPVSVMDESNGTPVVTNAIQVDAAINQGNSGGPTFNAAGQVVGINSSIASTTSSKSQAGSIGIGFAIPANLAKRIGNEIIKNGKVKHVALGIVIQSGNAESEGITRGGAKVVKVNPGTPAEKAGIKANDTIVAFNGQAVSNNYSLLGFVRAAEFGSEAKITLVRDGKALDVVVVMNQEEQAVTGTPKVDPNNRGKKKLDGNTDGEGEGDSNGGNDGKGFFDPFDYFFGQ